MSHLNESRRDWNDNTPGYTPPALERDCFIRIVNAFRRLLADPRLKDAPDLADLNDAYTEWSDLDGVSFTVDGRKYTVILVGDYVQLYTAIFGKTSKAEFVFAEPVDCKRYGLRIDPLGMEGREALTPVIDQFMKKAKKFDCGELMDSGTLWERIEYLTHL